MAFCNVSHVLHQAINVLSVLAYVLVAFGGRSLAPLGAHPSNSSMCKGQGVG